MRSTCLDLRPKYQANEQEHKVWSPVASVLRCIKAHWIGDAAIRDAESLFSTFDAYRTAQYDVLGTLGMNEIQECRFYDADTCRCDRLYMRCHYSTDHHELLSNAGEVHLLLYSFRCGQLFRPKLASNRIDGPPAKFSWLCDRLERPLKVFAPSLLPQLAAPCLNIKSESFADCQAVLASNKIWEANGIAEIVAGSRVKLGAVINLSRAA